MKDREPTITFNQEMAAGYDKMNAIFAPMRDSLYFLIHTIFAKLPTDAHILCVGAGTGSELIDLAQAFPQWQFTAVEPAAPMLDICRQRVEESGITSRCTFHEGYLDSLTATKPFDAATCLFVSHFCLQSEERRNFFHQIALRLRPQGHLINADLASDRSDSAYSGILEIWLGIMKSAGMPDEKLEKMPAVYNDGLDMAMLPPREVASIIAGGGFDSPVMFYQNLLMCAWYAKRNTILRSAEVI